ncbi:MAG: hypothetical protein GX446_04770 [Chthonomonadales bacterium]|nr:hypothetical protein [Chthonomonadales bacterium]
MKDGGTLATFQDTLRRVFPEAHLEIGDEAISPGDAAERVETLCTACVSIRRCEDALANREEYLRYVDGLAEALGVDTDRARSVISQAHPKFIVAGGAAAVMLLATATADASETIASAADVVQHGLDLVDVLEGVWTLGLSLLVSRWIGQCAARKNEAKRRELEALQERAYLIGVLADGLMSPHGAARADAALMRLRAIEADTPAGGSR